MPNQGLLVQAPSTPSHSNEGQVVTVKLAELATYEVNIRSFHPGKDFGLFGAFFEGDARSYSLKPSGLSGVAGTEVTSRVWHKFFINSAINEILFAQTESNDSGMANGEHVRYDGELKPRGGGPPSVKTEKGAVTTVVIEGKYAGENHAVYGSKTAKALTGKTFVPSLDVSYKITLTIDRVSKYIDIATHIKGDGFPNCEAFISDASGTAVFLGVHVRKGGAAWSLPGEGAYPMIESAIRLEIDDDGYFSGNLGNELRRKKLSKDRLDMRPITEWNDFFLTLNPNDERWKYIYFESFPDAQNEPAVK